MTDEAALVAAVVAAPDDETPRLVVADYWDDYGDTECAAFVRLECQLGRLHAAHPQPYRLAFRARQLLCISDGVFQFEGHLDPELEQRDEELVKRHGSAWNWGVARLVGYFGFRRGFVEEVGMSGREFLAGAPEVFRRAPVRHITFSRTPTALLPELTACPHLARLRSASFAHKAIGPRGAELLARCPYLSNLEELELTHCRVGDAGLAALLTSPHLTRLTVLDLWNNDLGDAAADLLLSPGVRVRLSYLRLQINGFSRDAEQALRAAYGDRADFKLPPER